MDEERDSQISTATTTQETIELQNGFTFLPPLFPVAQPLNLYTFLVPSLQGETDSKTQRASANQDCSKESTETNSSQVPEASKIATQASSKIQEQLPSSDEPVDDILPPEEIPNIEPATSVIQESQQNKVLLPTDARTSEFVQSQEPNPQKEQPSQQYISNAALLNAPNGFALTSQTSQTSQGVKEEQNSAVPVYCICRKPDDGTFLFISLKISIVCFSPSLPFILPFILSFIFTFFVSSVYSQTTSNLSFSHPNMQIMFLFSFMIECEQCNEWFHCHCVGIDPSQAEQITYICPNCTRIFFFYRFLPVIFLSFFLFNDISKMFFLFSLFSIIIHFFCSTTSIIHFPLFYVNKMKLNNQYFR